MTKVTARSGLWRKRASCARAPSSSRSAFWRSSRPCSRVRRPPDRTFDRMPAIALAVAGMGRLLRDERARQAEEGFHAPALPFAQLESESLQVGLDLGNSHGEVPSH